MAHTINDWTWLTHGDDSLQVDPTTVRQTGARIGELAAALRAATEEPALSSETTIGHAGLAAALNEFLDASHSRQVELADHLEAVSAQTGRAAQRYENTDTAAAGTLDPS